MIKIEIIHNTEILKQLKILMKTEHLSGFTSLNIKEGYGPLNGEYKADHIGDEQYLTIVLLEEETQANNLIATIRKIAPSHKFIALKSIVEKIA